MQSLDRATAIARSCSHRWNRRSPPARPLRSRQAQQSTPSCVLPERSLHPLHQPNSPSAELGHARSKMYWPRRGPSWRHLDERDALSRKASVEPEHWSMAPSPTSTTHWMHERRPVSIEYDYALQQKIASVDQSWCLDGGSAA